VSQGITYYKSAITRKPALAGPGGYLPPLHYIIAVIKMNGKDTRFTDDHAIKLIEEAIGIYPEFAPAHYELAKNYHKQNNIELALQQAKITAELAPDNGGIQKELGLLYARYIEDRNEMVVESAAKKGIDALKHAVKLNPKDPEIHETLGMYYGVLGMFELKAFEMDTAISLKPKGSCYLELGNAYLAMGNIDKARDAYLQAVKIDPALTIAIGFSGYCDYLKNLFHKACGQFEQYAGDQSLKEVYRKLWHYYALWGDGKKSQGDEILAGFSGTFNGTEWERNLLDFHMNRINETDLVARAKNRFDRCEAFHYIGCHHWHEGDKTGAESYFRQAMETKIYSLFEYAGARIRCAELSSLSASKTK
jgi:tetratricopeptide (TPR) repeat protein